MQTEIGPAAVQRGKLRDRAASAGGAGDVGAERIRFTSAILPRWARRVYQRGRRTQGDLAFSTFDHANQHRIPPLIHIQAGLHLPRHVASLKPSSSRFGHSFRPVLELLDQDVLAGT